ncbi:hypothetical protein HOLleu_23829 [Holothuria leucospilota]|uniref:Uncharacterized protein n=1 Tax=Holothuria leucospilota TaxID=206669 RepID=A0A9Q1BVJ6_HOLLE|nr:hypothetical protein HOLleu_23829 [Holothuria leucospilota]
MYVTFCFYILQEKINEIERRSGFFSQNGKVWSAFGRLSFRLVRRLFKRSFSFWAEYMGRAVREEISQNKEVAKGLHAKLLECHFIITNKKKYSVCEKRKDQGYVPHEEVAASLPKEEVTVSIELLKLVRELKIDVTEKQGDHECGGLCACYHVPEEGLQTTPLDLVGKEVQKTVDPEKCLLFSKDFQGSVRERLKEKFPSLLDGAFCSYGVMKSKSRKISRQNKQRKSSKRKLDPQQKAENVRDPQLHGDETHRGEIGESSTYVNAGAQTSGASGKSVYGESDRDGEVNCEGTDQQKVAEAFIDFADRYSKKPIIILADYKFENFLRDVKDVVGQGGCISRQKGDFDLIVIIPQMGIFLGQFKDTKEDGCNFKRYICKAAVQCQKDKPVFSEMFRDKISMFDLPIYEFIGVPHVSKETLDERCNFTQCPSYSYILTKDDLQDRACFKSWIQKRLGEGVEFSDDWIISEEQYWTLLERFIGFGSQVDDIGPYPKLIGDQCFNIPLTDEQRRLINTNTDDKQYMTLAGDYGTAKSLLLISKALKIAREIYDRNNRREGKIKIIACSDICISGEFLDMQFPDHGKHHLQKLLKDQYKNIISVETFRSFTQAESHDLSGQKGVDLLIKAILQKLKDDPDLYLMFDEVPAHFVEKLQCYKDVLSEYWQSVNMVWLVVGTNSYRVRYDGSVLWNIEDCKPSPKFEHMYLSKVLRSPRKVFHLCEKISKCSGDDHQGSLINFYEGPQPLLFRVPPCGCSEGKHINGPSGNQVESIPLKFACMSDRLFVTLKAIFCEIGIYKNGNIVDEWPGKVAMLVSGAEDETLFNDLHSMLIQCCKNFEGLCVRDTLIVRKKQGKGDNKSSDQGNHGTSQGVCCRVYSDTIIGEEGGASLFGKGSMDDNQDTNHENQVKGSCEGTSSLDSEPGSDRDGVLGVVGKEMAEGCSGGHNCKKRKGPDGLDYEQNTTVEDKSDVNSPEILLTRETHFVGCESHVVICIDLNAMKHWFKNTKVGYSTLTVSRCLSQYIHLTWHEEEAAVMFEMNVKALDEDLEIVDRKNLKEAAKEPSTLEYLLQEAVIKEKTAEIN